MYQDTTSVLFAGVSRGEIVADENCVLTVNPFPFIHHHVVITMSSCLFLSLSCPCLVLVWSCPCRVLSFLALSCFVFVQRDRRIYQLLLTNIPLPSRLARTRPFVLLCAHQDVLRRTSKQVSIVYSSFCRSLVLGLGS
jgi:hypothetical protein